MHQKVCRDCASALVVFANGNKLEGLFLERDEGYAFVDVAEQDQILERSDGSDVNANIEESDSQKSFILVETFRVQLPHPLR